MLSIVIGYDVKWDQNGPFEKLSFDEMSVNLDSKIKAYDYKPSISVFDTAMDTLFQGFDLNQQSLF